MQEEVDPVGSASWGRPASIASIPEQGNPHERGMQAYLVHDSRTHLGLPEAPAHPLKAGSSVVPSAAMWRGRPTLGNHSPLASPVMRDANLTYVFTPWNVLRCHEAIGLSQRPPPESLSDTLELAGVVRYEDRTAGRSVQPMSDTPFEARPPGLPYPCRLRRQQPGEDAVPSGIVVQGEHTESRRLVHCAHRSEPPCSALTESQEELS